MSRVADLAFLGAILLLCGVSCDAALCGTEPSPSSKCVKAQVPSGYGGYKATKVATCEQTNYLETATQCLQSQVDTFSNTTDARIEAQLQQVDELQADVDDLMGKNNELINIVASLELDGSNPRVLCEIYTYGEALIIAKMVFGVDNPNPHFVHIPCGDECPTEFYKIRQNCLTPSLSTVPIDNDPMSGLGACFYDPVPLGETCTRVLFLGGNGYTANLSNVSLPMM